MAIGGGYRNHILRVDLGQGTVERQPLPGEDVLRKYVGGAGLGLYYLLEGAPPDVAATHPDAPLMFMTGPLTGTPAVSSSDWTTICYSLLNSYAAGVGHGHGMWGAYLKHSGHDGIYLTGAAEKPSYLWIDDDHVEIRDASHLWGLDTRETERRIKIELGDELNISVACIGPAGEAELPGAMVKADRNHGSRKGSPGAVMGSKNLKAIAVRGTSPVPLANPENVLDAAEEWSAVLKVNGPGRNSLSDNRDRALRKAQNNYERLEIPMRVAAGNMADANWGTEFARKYVEACQRWRVTARPSFNCTIDCAYDVEITDGPMSGFVGSPCGGADNIEGFCSFIGVDDPATVVVMTDFFDAMGLESGQLGPVIGKMYQSYENGTITSSNTDGLDLSWGNWESAMALVRKTIAREGVGETLLGDSASNRNLQGDERGLMEKMRARILRLEGESDPRANAVRETQYGMLFCDSLGVCNFGVQGIPESLRLTSECLGQTVGWEGFNSEEALLIGERVINLMRLVYIRRGFTKEDEGAPTDEYYRLMGWDTDTGQPSHETLARLGMDEIVTRV